MQKEIPTKFSPLGMLDWPCGVERLQNGNTLITDGGYWSGVGSEIIEVDLLGQVVWRYSDNLLFAHSAKLTDEGNVLISDTWNNRVLEVTREGRIVWTSDNWASKTGKLSDGSHLSYPNDIEKTERGTYLISDRNNNRMLEVTREGEVVWQYKNLKHCHDADRLENGNTLVASSDENKVIEVDPKGNIVWSYGDGNPEILNWPRDADRLENGNTLITDSKNNRIIEVDPKGNIVWSYELGYFGMPYEADRVENGNTLISIQQRRIVIEVDPSGSIVWSFRNFYRNNIKPYLLNGNFEKEDPIDKNLPSSWTGCHLLSEGFPCRFLWEKNTFKGKPAIGIEYSGEGSCWWQQTVRVKPGTLYRLKDFIRTENLDGFAQTQVAFLDKMGGFFVYVADLPGTKPRKGTCNWQEASLEVRAPEEATAADIRCILIGSGRVFFADVAFEELPWG